MSETAEDGKTIAIISYITLIGWIIALVMHQSNKTSLGAFHIRQMLGLMLFSLAISIVGQITGLALVLWVLNLGLLVLWVLGLVGAIQGEEKEVPLVGSLFQDWFKGVA
ncbi:hypothetical protein [Gilvibacter sp. SZ-19]|uniref:hypothetical protein n=1 Tax=unclassified Gilvibacter TaxID=2625242 RepID=UPI000B3CFC3A|nr:hypothetical protein [Gilvibacter sp. SZ-19]ARV13215.1 hypothetical protein BTO09_13065 [Gilvibacter sp. SZ-19]